MDDGFFFLQAFVWNRLIIVDDKQIRCNINFHTNKCYLLKFSYDQAGNEYKRALFWKWEQWSWQHVGWFPSLLQFLLLSSFVFAKRQNPLCTHEDWLLKKSLNRSLCIVDSVWPLNKLSPRLNASDASWFRRLMTSLLYSLLYTLDILPTRKKLHYGMSS